MICEISVGGVYLPSILVLSIAALAPTALLSAVLRRLNAYRLVAYPALFDFSLFMVTLGLLVEATATHSCTL